MIVVAGGSGRLGRLVVADLLARGERVTVLTRDPDRARGILAAGVDVVRVDVRDPSTLEQVCSGASVVVSALHGFLGARGAGPQEVDRTGNRNLAQAALAAGSDVVLVSVLGADPRSPLDLSRAKFAAEQDLRGCGAQWTVVRAAPFLETWLDVLQQTAIRSGRPLVFGKGTRPVPFVSVTDVAALVSTAATDTALRGQVLEIGGHALTVNEMAHAARSAGLWRGKPRRLPRALLSTMGLVARPVAPAFARQNRAALLMDTISLGTGDPTLRERLGLPPAVTITDVLQADGAPA